MTVSGWSPTPFVGRDHELEVLAGALDPDAVESTLVRVSGEAGVGKSRLVAEAVQRAGRRALAGSSSPGSLGRPYDLVLSAVEPAVRGWAEIPASLTGVRSALVELLHGVAPGLADDRPADPPSPADVMGAGTALVRHLDPEVLVLEDLHWADVESLQVVERLLAAPEHPVIVATYRSEDLDGRASMAELLSTMGARRSSRRLHLEPFGTDEIARLVSDHTGRAPSSTVVERLRVRTGGNAFFLEELIASTDGWEHPDDDPDHFPETLTETVRLRLRGLSPEERDTLATAAVLGSPFEFDLLATSLDVDEAELIDRLRTLIDRRVVVEPEIDVFRFRHELVRESVLASLLGRERRRLHDRAWTATVAHHPDAYAELARHAAGSGRLDELARLAPKGVRHYLDRGSTRQALVLAELALDEWPDDVELRELAARAAWLTGQGDAAQRHATRWREATESMPNDHGIDALALLARIAYERDDHDTESAIVSEMEGLLGDVSDPSQRARLLTELAQHHMLMSETERAVARAGEARTLAEQHGLDSLLFQIAVEQASAEAGTEAGRDEALAALERIAKEAEHAGEFVTAARALHNLSLYQPPDVADATLDRMGVVAERGGFDLASALLLPVRKADVAVGRADLFAAQQWIDRARPLVRRLKSGKHLRFHEVLIRQETGIEIDDEMLDELPPRAAWVWSVLLRRAALQGRRDEVEALLADPPVEDPSAFLALGSSLGDLRAGGTNPTALAAAGDVITESGCPQLGADLAAALLAERVGASDAADRLGAIDDSAQVIVQSTKATFGALLDAEVAMARARVALRAGQRDEGRRHARRAAELLSRWPGRRRDEALALAADEVCSDELTGREIDVARLVARGMTNGQIAEELFIARKTVSTHVSNILMKLDMSSRTEIATWMVRSGLATDEPATSS
ncbi:MAG: LuxR C-terminal-related transcriptional regulator [Actinomycetota bacterium]